MAMTRTDEIDTLFSTTFARSKKTVINQIFKQTRLLTYLASKKTVQGKGGTEWRFPVLMGRNNTVTYIGPSGEVSTEGDDPVRMATYKPVFLAASVKQVFTTQYKNAGPEKLIDIVQTSINLAKSEVSLRMEADLNGDGSTTNGPHGLAELIPIDPTASVEVGAINQSTYSWWRSQKIAASGSAGTYLSKDLRHLNRLCSEFGPEPDFILVDGDGFEIIQNVLEEKHLFMDDKMKDLGWPDVPVFKGKPIIWSSEAPASVVRMVNLTDMMIYYDPSVWFQLGDWLQAQNNVNKVAHLICAWNLVSQRRSTSGVMTGLTE